MTWFEETARANGSSAGCSTNIVEINAWCSKSDAEIHWGVSPEIRTTAINASSSTEMFTVSVPSALKYEASIYTNDLTLKDKKYKIKTNSATLQSLPFPWFEFKWAWLIRDPAATIVITAGKNILIRCQVGNPTLDSCKDNIFDAYTGTGGFNSADTPWN
jgi:hypothetical protein